MDSAHAEAAVVLINAGADRGRVRLFRSSVIASLLIPSSLKLNLDGEVPEDVPGVGGLEQKRAKQHVIDLCGKP